MVVKNKMVWSKVKPLTKDLKINSEIYSVEEFREVLKYERIRADRSESIFSITLFKSPEIYESKKNLKLFISGIIKQARLIDHIGWNDDYIAALLPETGKTGAEIFSRKIVDEIDFLDNNNIITEIYTYPDGWLDKAEKSISTRSEDARAKKLDFSACVEDSFTSGIPVWKRAVDVALSSIGLTIASPIFLFLALYIKIVSPGPVFFHQPRVGYKGKEFCFWKFRSMHSDNKQSFHGKHAQSFIKNGDVPMEKLDDRDPRIIPGGRVMRKSCIDELPQLWNVLKGDMSLVGPRPCIPYEAEEYLRWHTHRFDVVPGLTGLWQVSGKNKLTFKQMIRLDIMYSNNLTPWNDAKIILKTPSAIIRMVAEATMNKIRGYYPGENVEGEMYIINNTKIV